MEEEQTTLRMIAQTQVDMHAIRNEILHHTSRLNILYELLRQHSHNLDRLLKIDDDTEETPPSPVT